MSKIEILDPLTYPGWDELILSHPGYSFFHSSAWARVLAHSYGYTPFYFAVLEGGKICALLAVMEVNSRITGKRGVSLPFTDSCEPLREDRACVEGLLDLAVQYGNQRGWRYLELRGGQDHFPYSAVWVRYFGHRLDLTAGKDSLLSGFRDSTRRNIKRAAASLDVKIGTGIEEVQEFYRLNCLTRKEHGLPPQPYRFFQKIHENVLLKNLGFIVLAIQGKRSVGGAVFFHFGNRAIYKYGASDKRFQEVRGNNLVMWEGIRESAVRGCRTLDFGRTEAENSGLRQFKSGWGTVEYPLSYYRYGMKKKMFLAGKRTKPQWYAGIVREMPSPFLKFLGSSLYRHMG